MTDDFPACPDKAGPAPAAALCRDCGQPLPAGAAPGFCPLCVFREMDETLGDDPTALFEAVPLRLMGGYELLEVIGRGGMGTVYRARHNATGEERALKTISAGELASPAARRRFLQEAGAAAALQHPNVVRIHEAGSQDGMPFYVMDYVRGRTLADAVREKPMPPHAAAACTARVAAAIHHAHERGVLHRDLKPSNILLDHLGEPHVTDFGLARHVNADSSLTGSQQIMGSPAYMPPEQAAGRTRSVTAAADIYSLGAVLYHLLTGRPPFQGDSPQAVLRQVTDDEPVPPRRIVPSIPREVETIAMKCLEKHPGRRYANAAALERDLQRFLQGEPILTRPVSTAGRWLRRARRNPALTAATALLVAGALAGLAYILHSNRRLRRSDAEKSIALTEKEATLAESLLWQAEFQRLTGKPGQREGSLQAVNEVLKLPLTAEQKLRARDAAIAALALPDAKFIPQPDLPAPANPALAMTDRYATRYVCVAPDGKLTITDLNTGKVIAAPDLAPRRIDALLNLSYDGTLLAYRYDGTRLGAYQTLLGPVLWSDEVWSRPEHAWQNQVAFQPVQRNELVGLWRMVHPDKNGAIVIREAYTGFVLNRIPPPDGPPPEWRALGYSLARNLLAAACGSRPEIVIWNMDRSPPVVERTLKCQDIVQSLDWENAENWLLAGDVAGRLTAWDARTGEPQPPFEGHTQPVLSTVSGRVTNFRHISSAGDGTIRLWDRGALSPMLTLPGHASRLCLDNAEVRLGPLLNDGRTGWYDLSWPGGFALLSPPEKSEGPRRAAWHPNGDLIASLTANSAVVWRRARGNSNSLVIPARHPNALCFSPNGRWLAIAAADGLHLAGIRRSTANLEAALSRRGDDRVLLPGSCQDVTFNAANTLMAAVRGDGTLEVHEMNPDTDQPGQLRHTFHGNPDMRCALSPHGRWLAAGSQGSADATVWDLATGAVAAEPPAARAARSWLPSFSPDSRWLVFSGRTAQLLPTGNWLASMPVPAPPNESMGRGAVFIATGESNRFWLAAAGADEEVHVFRAAVPLTKLAVLRAPRSSAVGDLVGSRHGVLACALGKGEVHLWDLFWYRRKLAGMNLGLENP
jgi:serine/threonine protein kinase/WD40 repeat protein